MANTPSNPHEWDWIICYIVGVAVGIACGWILFKYCNLF